MMQTGPPGCENSNTNEIHTHPDHHDCVCLCCIRCTHHFHARKAGQSSRRMLWRRLQNQLLQSSSKGQKMLRRQMHLRLLCQEALV